MTIVKYRASLLGPDEVRRGPLGSDEVISTNVSIVTQRTGLTQIVNQPTRTRGSNMLDRIFESSPIYTGIKVVASTLKSDHRVIIAYSGSQPKDINKKRTVLQYRPRTPGQHAAFLAHLSHMNWDEVIDITDTQTAFDKLCYCIVYVRHVLPIACRYCH